jgi:hypothetical protein
MPNQTAVWQKPYLRKIHHKCHLSHCAQKLCLENEFALLILLTRLKCLVILPSDCLLALLAVYVSHDVSTSCHVPFACFPLSDVDDAIEKVGFAMLATEVLHRDCNQYTST